MNSPDNPTAERLVLWTLLFCLPIFSQALVISEIMYDPKGSDVSAGDEWIEVYNDEQGPIDLTARIFFENETNHSISTEGEKFVPAGEYAIISKDPSVFRDFFVGFSGLVFKSSFSLNDGERLALKTTKTGPETDVVEYSSEWGAKNDGNSLHRTASGWIAGAPTPGAVFSDTSSDGAGSAENPQTATSSPSSSNTVTTSAGGRTEDAPVIRAHISGPDTAVAGATVSFSGSALGLEGKPLDGGRFVWNFGDGGWGEGERTGHIWASPGDYVLFLEVSSGKISGIARKVIRVLPPDIFIEETKTGEGGFVSIRNNLGSEADISGWMIKAGDKIFAMPKNSVVLPKTSIRLAEATAGFSFASGVSLHFPNGSPTPKVVQNVKKLTVSVPDPAPSLPLAKKALSEAPVPINAPVTDNPASKAVSEKNAEAPSSTEVLAQVSSSRGGSAKWYVLFAMVLVAGSAGFIYLGRSDTFEQAKSDGLPNKEIKEMAKQFEIVE